MEVEFARAMFDEAKHDLHCAELTLEGKEFARTVKNCGEACEKAAKAILLLHEPGTIIDHKVSKYLLDIEEFNDYRIIFKAMNNELRILFVGHRKTVYDRF